MVFAHYPVAHGYLSLDAGLHADIVHRNFRQFVRFAKPNLVNEQVLNNATIHRWVARRLALQVVENFF